VIWLDASKNVPHLGVQVLAYAHLDCGERYFDYCIAKLDIVCRDNVDRISWEIVSHDNGYESEPAEILEVRCWMPLPEAPDYAKEGK